MTFDVRAHGNVDPGSVALDPPMPEPFDACFATYFASGHFDNVSADGERVTPQFGRRDRGADDAGVPRLRSRSSDQPDQFDRNRE